jgi:D-alanyl-D-alanine carboxypeptidase (penicillin-binding protein 5/6)
MRVSGVFLVILLLFPAIPVYAWEPLPVLSPSAILVEQSTGQVLYAKNEHTRRYPASMTKILTCLVVVDYLQPDDVIVVGPEIRAVAAGYNTNIHFEGESITVRNLMRALMVRSGNETGIVLAVNVVRAKEGRYNITYEEADRAFSTLMNQKARSLGAMESHFNNPYGLHSENHYTTAYDMAILSRAFMDNDELRAIASMREYHGDSLEGRIIEGALTRQYDWTSINELLPGSPNAYPYATGLKTGFTDAAGFCLSAAATKMGFSLISVVFLAEEPAIRFQDTRVLLDYGFFTYAMRPFQTGDDLLETAVIVNPRLGEGDELALLTGDSAQALLSLAQLERIRRELIYDEAYLPGTDDGYDESQENGGRIRLKAPIEKNAVVGTVQYILDGIILYEGPILASAEILERNFDSDMDYYMRQFRENVFSRRGLPYWVGGFGFLAGIIGITLAVTANRKLQRNSYPRYRGFK